MAARSPKTLRNTVIGALWGLFVAGGALANEIVSPAPGTVWPNSSTSAPAPVIPTCYVSGSSGPTQPCFPNGGQVLSIQPDVGTTGQSLSAALNSTLVQPLTNGRSTVRYTITGLTASGAVLTLKGSIDGGATYQAKYYWTNSAGAAQTLSADTSFSVDAAGLTDLELLVTTGGTGTITVSQNASVAPGYVTIVNPPSAPVNVQVQESVAVTGTLTANLGTIGGAATAANQTTANSSLSTIAANTAVTVAGTPATSGAPIQGMTGGVPVPVSLATLPGFTATPTVNLGTLGGAATATNQAAIQSAPGTPQTMAQTIQGNASGVPVPTSLATLPALVAGSAVAGKFGIDQTTPGTTNNVTVTPQAVTVTWAGGSVTTGGAFQSALATSSSRKGCQIQNTSSGIEYVNSSGSPTVLNADQINPYGTYTCSVTTDLVDQAAIEISGATTGQTYVVASW